jgi:putative hydrolase of the HAD superfamily
LPFIYFDAGFTLIRPHPGVGEVYAEHAARYGVVVSAAEMNAHFRTAWRRCRSESPAALPYGRTEAEARAFWYRVITETIALTGNVAPAAPEFLPELFDAFAGGRHWRAYDDVAETFELLRARGIPFGVLSNWDLRLRSVLAALFPDETFAAVVISAEAGAEKPSRAIFEFAESVIPEGMAVDGIAMIGDERDADGNGARGAGWDVCVLDREGRLDPEGALPLARTLPDAVRQVLGVRA